MSEPLRTVGTSEPEDSLKDAIEGIIFPIGTIEELDHLEHRIRTCPLARDKFVTNR